ncbi:14995_t:CDS:2, partial [Dentiscutata heterogama]
VTDVQRLKSKHQKNTENKGENRHVSFIRRLQAFTNYLGADEDKDDEEISVQDDIYIIHSRDSSPTINDNDETVQKKINEIETSKEHYETIDDGTDNEDNFIPSNKVVNEQIKSQKFADEQLDEEIRSLLQLVGEAIFRQFQRQDSTLFQASENAIIHSETKLTQSLEKQFERKREVLNTYRSNYTLIASESQQMMNKLKEGRNDLETLEQTLIDMEKMDYVNKEMQYIQNHELLNNLHNERLTSFYFFRSDLWDSSENDLWDGFEDDLWNGSKEDF